MTPPAMICLTAVRGALSRPAGRASPGRIGRFAPEPPKLGGKHEQEGKENHATDAEDAKTEVHREK